MADEFEESKPETLDWERYKQLGKRHLWHFLVPFFCGWLVVWMVSWFLPSVYRSGTLILVEEPTVPQQFVMPNIAGNLQDRLQSITQQILSRTRLLRIIDQFGLYADARHRVAPDDLVERMRKDIEIELVRSPDQRELNAFKIYYSASDPRTAERVTRELTNLFINENLEVRRQQSERTTGFLERQLATARDKLAEQEQKVREFKEKHLGELPGQLQSNLQILSGLQNQMEAEDNALSRAKQQHTYLESLLTQYRTLQRSARGGEDAPVGLPALDRELERLRGQLADLSSHYTERHPDVRKLKEQIANAERLKARIMAEQKQAASGSKSDASSAAASQTDADPSETGPMVELRGQLRANQMEVTNHERAIDELKGKIGGYQARLNQAPMLEQQLTDLTRGYDQSKADYDSLLKKKNESELATSLERQQQGEHFRILDPPDAPVKPYSPNRLKLFAVALAIGLALGGGVSTAIEITDDRIYRVKELADLVSAKVIAEIPPLRTTKEQIQQVRQGWLRWAATGAVFTCVVAALAVTYWRG
jgi:protein tyrosine kinase modulator